MSTRIDLATELTEEELFKKAHELLESGKSLREFENIPSEGLEAVYFLAYHAYQAGNFGKADCLFKFLCYLDHQEKKYWLGLGANRQMQKDFAGAVEAYSMAGLLDLGDPRPPMRAADCYLALGNRSAAEDALRSVIKVAQNNPENESLRQRASTLLARLNDGNENQEIA